MNEVSWNALRAVIPGREDRGVHQHERGKGLRPLDGAGDDRMAAHRVADPDRAAKIERFGDGREVSAEEPPWIGRLGLAAASVAAEIDGDGAPSGALGG